MPSREGPLWGLSLLLSLGINGGLFVLLAMSTVGRTRSELQEEPPPVQVSGVALVVSAPSPAPRSEPAPKTAPADPAASLAHPPSGGSAPKPTFARTTEAQESEAPAAAFQIGERNTRATTDRAPEAGAPPETASQAGTMNGLVDGTRAKPLAPSSDPATPMAPAGGQPAAAAPQDKLVQGPNPVDVPVQAPPPDPAPAAVSQQPAQASPAVEPRAQERAELIGSISRKGGTAAQNVVDTPLGRYQAIINRAVEGEWLQNCQRYQQYITTGSLTVRFVVQLDGKVGSVTDIESVDCSAMQKSFTNESIHKAKLPRIPAELRKRLGDKPLEQTLIFYF